MKIDLSKNLLTKLPDDFGNLTKLQHLDLLGNKLSVLPVSVYQLNKLKWLDLKDNPLVPELKKVAGDCLDEKQCRKCATDVSFSVFFLKMEMYKIVLANLQNNVLPVILWFFPHTCILNVSIAINVLETSWSEGVVSNHNAAP